MRSAPEPLGPLVQPRVLHRDRELSRERAQERLLVLAQAAAALGVDGEQADQLLPHPQRDRDGSLEADLLERVANSAQPLVGGRIRDEQQTARAGRAQRQLEQPLPHPHVRAGEPPGSRGLEPRVLALLDEVDGEPVGRRAARRRARPQSRACA